MLHVTSHLSELFPEPQTSVRLDRYVHQGLWRFSPMQETIARYLEEDHFRIDDALRRASTSDDSIEPAAYMEFRGALLRHIGMEEKILLPAARRAGGAQSISAAERLHLDHGALAALLVLSPTRAIVTRIRTILDPHNK